MTPGEELTARFRHEDNCVSIGAEADVRVYFRQMAASFRGMLRALPGGADRLAVSALQGSICRLAYLYQVLEHRYRYPRPGVALKVDASDSGFVHFSTLLELEVDLAAREKRLGRPTVAELKQRMVDQIARERTFPRGLQEQLSERLYYEQLVEKELFWEFNSGPLVQVSRGNYLWSFSTYDRVMNRPFVYLLYLKQERPQELSVESAEFQALMSEAKKMASGRQSLLVFSKAIDDLPVPLTPRIVNRFIIGPVCNRFTINETSLDTVFSAVKEKEPFVFSWEAESLVSDREFRTGVGMFTSGKLKQVFWTPREAGLMARGVSHVDRYILTPHWFATYLNEAGLFTDHHTFTFDKEDEVYGIH
jgi:hypothetical protein